MKGDRHPLRRLMAIGLAASAMWCVSIAAAAADLAPDEFREATDFQQLRGFAQTTGDRLWAGYGEAPFGLLLVAPGQEVLLCQNEVPAGFTPSGETEAGCDRSVRPRSQLPGGLLAAMGVFGPRETIVMGSPDATGRAYPAWLRTILHEHFHQWQTSRPGYQEAMAALGLADNDPSAMWMLNFPVPYDEPTLVAAHARASLNLAAALDAKEAKPFRARFREYLAARKAFADAAGERNWRYIEFQLWQEGVARWTEMQLGLSYPDPTVREAAVALDAETRAELASPDLKRKRREFVYAYGAAETRLIERCDPSWRDRYLSAPSLGRLLEAAARRCGAV